MNPASRAIVWAALTGAATGQCIRANSALRDQQPLEVRIEQNDSVAAVIHRGGDTTRFVLYEGKYQPLDSLPTSFIRGIYERRFFSESEK